MDFIALLYYFLSVWFSVLYGVRSDCIWYGQCNVNEANKIQNCLYNGPANKTTDPHSIQILKKWCPSIPISPENSTHICCDRNQLKTLEENVSILKIFLGRCPSCFQSLLNHFCDMTCSPNQSNFINVTRTQSGVNGTYITSIDLYIAEEYGEKTFQTCKGVFVPSANSLALDIICGSWGSSKCTAKRWFEYMSSTEANQYVPFEINYVWAKEDSVSSEFVPLNWTVIPCNESVNRFTPKCNCLDCQTSCPSVIYQTTNYETLDVLKLIAIILFVCLSGVLIIFYYRSTEDNNNVEINNSNDADYDLKGTVEDTEDSLEMTREENNDSGQLNNLTTSQICFKHVAVFCGKHTGTVLLISVLVVIALSSGIYTLHVITEPIELWSAESSPCRTEREYYQKHFGPFYRIQQVILKPVGLPNVIHNTSNGIIEFGPAFNFNFLKEVKLLQDKIMELGEPGNKLQHLCFAPLISVNSTPAKSSKCLVQSIWGYYQNDAKIFERRRFDKNNHTVNYLDHFITCSQNSFNPICLGKYGGPIDPAIAVGGFLQTNETSSLKNPYEKATSVILTFLLKNHYDKTKLKPALSWEETFIKFMKNWTLLEKSKKIEVSFYSERSVEDEVNREASESTPIVAISYIVTFTYIVLFMGRINSFRPFLVNTQILVGLAAVLLILISVASSFSLCGFFGVPVTLIGFQVVPFVVMTIGTNKIFFLAKTYWKVISENCEKSVEKCLEQTLIKVGPPMLTSTVVEAACFLTAFLLDIPAVKLFALHAGVAVILNMILLSTYFSSILILDARKFRNDKSTATVLHAWIRNKFIPTLSKPKVHMLIVFLFFGLFCVNLTLMSKVKLGFDQELAMPKDSYLVKYFQDIRKYLSIGPPVYFVVEGNLNITDNETDQNALCGGQYCNIDSVVNQIYVASKWSERTSIARPPSSWIDDYIDWSSNEQCCRQHHMNGSYCPHDDALCDLCDIKLNKMGRPIASDFQKYLPYFLMDNPTPTCAKGGHAAYSQAMKYSHDSHGSLSVYASSFMTYHTALKSSEDYYGALKAVKTLANNMTNMLKNHLGENSKAQVFPYSVFYVYYEQYLTIRSDTLQTILLSVLSTFTAILVLRKFNIFSASITCCSALMIIIDVLACMYFFNIQLNALTLINVIAAIGISVHFSYCVTQCFVESRNDGNNVEGVIKFANMGTIMIYGTILMNVVGLIVLSCTKSTIFDVFYFRMYSTIIAISSLHSLIFLPALVIFIKSSWN